MTSHRLHETDLVNICGLPEKEQFLRLRAKRSFPPPHSLEPTRRCIHSLFGVNPPMFPSEAFDDEKALGAMRRSIRRDVDRAPNLRRAKAILAYRRQSVSAAIHEPMRDHRVTVDNSVRLNHSLIIETDTKRQIPFLDLRKSGALTSAAREFVFSLNFHLLIDETPFSDFGLVILKYWEENSQNFGLTPYVFNGEPKYSYDELKDMIANTYAIWLEVLDERRRGGFDDGDIGIGPLFA